MKKTGVLLVNLGTPNSPAVEDVRRYLKEFLNDPKVIDINPILRRVLVNGIILPFRAPHSAEAYGSIWDIFTGSPLMHYSLLQKNLLAKELGDDFIVELGMRYQNPSIIEALENLRRRNVGQILVIPMFPQYADATTGSVIKKVNDIVNDWPVAPPVRFIEDFHDHPLLISSFCKRALQCAIDDFDHVVFSFHGLPQRQIRKCDRSGRCLRAEDCCWSYGRHNKRCYSAQSHHTARLIAKELNLNAENFTVSFQSRLGRDEWMRPYTIDILRELASCGKKNVLVLCPSFVTDCLETISEIGNEYSALFLAAGGHHLQLVESVNDDDLFIDALVDLVHADQHVYHIKKGGTAEISIQNHLSPCHQV